MAAQVSAQIAADAQVAASQFAAEGLGHAFVLRKPLAKGKSRSGTLAAAYLMFRDDVDDGEALRRIRTARPFVSPNRGFLEQLATHGPELRFAGREEKLP
ncbi:hypothetical protein SO694_00023255 [Aureococcus anophagefferens]|uniref:Dual specificity phosphatase catalytic domain-containing protein n=1 Tax=Aureococcus anophagefferens TaxID=44056 RepID=A0ABR1FTJ1_AURAN|nr:hypothetical protein JL720_2104 [Aureococcus anophagefferens]